MRTTRRAPALLALSVLIALTALLSINGSAAAQSTVDYDTDDDGYIDVSTHAQLNAIRWDLDANGDPASANATDYGTAFPNRVTTSSGRMGCPSGTCTGYELTADIDLDTDGDGNIGTDSGDAYYDSGNGWMPIGSDTSATTRYSGHFKGNQYTIDNLFINRGANDQALFGATHTTSRIESLGVTNANVTGRAYTAVLVGSHYGTVVACYTTGSVSKHSSSTSDNTNSMGGLVGWSQGSVSTSYSTASVSGVDHVGGLLGNLVGSGTVTNSYSTGSVSGTGSNIGGLIGQVQSVTNNTATKSYWDTTTSGQTTSAGGTDAVPKTTTQLQSPTGYTGIYSTWNLNLDGQTGNDDPWDFGTSSEYPTLKYGALIDYDEDDDNYIEVSGHAQLNAIRYDLNGNGAQDSVSATHWGNYTNAFPSAANGMGCAATCTGYELTADIDLDTNGSGGPNPGDAYWDGGEGWKPIGSLDDATAFTGDFKGNGFTIDHLYIYRSATTTTAVGLFGFASAASRIESVGLTNVNVRGNTYVGALVGGIRGVVVACWSTGSVTATTGPSGGLVGWTPNAISSSYSHASATGTLHVGGLLGACQNCTVTHSYATGVVTRSGSGSDTRIGGLMGSGGSAAATASYYDSATTGCVSGGSNGCTTSAGGSGAVAKTTSELQSPTGYTGIYANWNANLDGVAGNDYPWYFGSFNRYPTLIYGTTVDYDADGDGYIDIETLAQLNAVRHDLNGNGDSTHADYIAAFPRRDTNAATRMGCPTGTCTGYELTANLEFDSDGDGDVDANDHGGAYDNSGAGFSPIGTFTDKFTADFKGNGYTINNLFISRSAVARQALFGATSPTARIETLGVTNANVTGQHNTGILVGSNEGEVVACYTTGSVSGSDRVGGIVGYQGRNAAFIQSSYSHASVSGGQYVGGVLGRKFGNVTNSYSTGAVSGSSNVGGLIGASSQGSATNSYWDTQTSGRSTSGGGGTGKTTSELQTVTSYTGIYADWNADIDSVSGNDDPWNFCSGSQYPALKYGGHNPLRQDGCGDYDSDDDGYIEIESLAQLNAVRYDLNANGARDTTTTTLWANHTSAFVNAAAGMGCPATCTGYELAASLDFDSDADGDVDVNDHSGDYWDSGAGWSPIGANTSAATRYSGDFKGNGHTINNLFINRSTNNVGLFGAIHSTARIETLGVTNANVTGGSYTGVLVGAVHGAVVACYTTGAVTGNHYVGGLVGFTGVGASSASIRSSYSTAYTVGSTNIGGLIGRLAGGSMSHVYATGRVARKSDSTSSSLGGIAGASSSMVTASYYDTSTSGCVTGGSPGCTDGDGGNSVAGITGKTARELQTVTSYTGIFANWNANLDGVAGNDDPWDFGNGMQYPMLDYDGMSTAPQGGLAMGIPDNWNAPIVGERVGVCIAPGSGVTRATVSGQSYKKAWIWEKSANGDTWGAVSGSIRNPTYEYNPVAADAGSYLRAKVELTDGSFAYTRVLGGRVKETSAATAGSAITFYSGNTSPQVGTIIIANDPRPSGAVDARFSWQRCDNADATYTDCEYIPRVWWNNYTPVAADLNHYLRIVVYYETSAGVWTRHASAFTGQVAAASQ